MRVYDKEGCRLTSCCECYSTYSMDDGSLTCKKCHREVPEGEGDGIRRLSPNGLATRRLSCTWHHTRSQVTTCALVPVKDAPTLACIIKGGAVWIVYRPLESANQSGT